MELSVVGGLYVERCIQPLWDAVFGSGGRAAAAAVNLVPSVALTTYVPNSLRDDAEALAGQYGFKIQADAGGHPIQFDYLHPLSIPRITPPVGMISTRPSVSVNGELVLRFGMLEGDAVVRADIAVYDPQSAFEVKRFSENGSKAGRLAIVLNRGEAAAMTGIHDPAQAAAWLIENEGAEAVIVKMGGQGAYVTTKEKSAVTPIYSSERVWKIGSGDVFSAAFASFWGARGLDPFAASVLASKATAMYCDSRTLPIPAQDDLERAELESIRVGSGQIYLAGPFFDIGQRWLIEEARTLLSELGAEVFSPVHEVGPGPGHIVAPLDIKGIEDSNVVFAILNGLDTGTVFEIGFAVKAKRPVIVLAQNVREEDMKMLVGTGCEIVDDFASAIYRAIWRLPTA